VTDALSGSVPGDDAAQRATRVAGALAELGATLLILHPPGAPPRPLPPRQTNLPHVLATADPGTRLECTDLGILILVSSSALRWQARDQAAADTFRAATSASAR